jgi:DNA-binding transcriptional regulator YiaG
MTTEKKTESFVFEGLGFPIFLVDAPWKKVFGEWVLDINLKELQDVVLQTLIHKSNPLNGCELRFIRKFLELSTAAFGKLFGVSHVAVVKWENDQSQINPATELCIRLHVMDRLLPKDKEFRKFYHDMSIETLKKHKKSVRKRPIKINASHKLCPC